MNKEIQEIIGTIEDLNQIIFDSTFFEIAINDGLFFTYTTDGIDHIIKFNEAVIWHSEDDNRFFNEEINEYENLKTFLVRVFREKSEQQKIISDYIFDKVIMK